jgi:DNA-binding response OmpR family regulator
MSTGALSTNEQTAAPAAILVADDDELIRELLCQVLEAEGFSVLEAATGREVLEQVKKKPVAVVILDLVMPEMDGLETLQSLAQNHPGVRVLAVSGAFGGSFLDCARLLGAKAILKKPFNGEELLAGVRALLPSANSSPDR